MSWVKQVLSLDEEARRRKDEERRRDGELRAFRDRVIASVAAIPIQRWVCTWPGSSDFRTRTDRGAEVAVSMTSRCVSSLREEYQSDLSLVVDGETIYGWGCLANAQGNRQIDDLYKRLVRHFKPQWDAHYAAQRRQAEEEKARQEEHRRRDILGRL